MVNELRLHFKSGRASNSHPAHISGSTMGRSPLRNGVEAILGRFSVSPQMARQDVAQAHMIPNRRPLSVWIVCTGVGRISRGVEAFAESAFQGLRGMPG